MHSEKNVSEFNPRKCDCDYCRKHGCMYVSDPRGSVDINIKNIDDLNKYRQGSNLADLYVCKRCGVSPLLTFESEGNLYAALNAPCFDSFPELGDAVAVSPKKLNAEEKINRWCSLWIPEVRIHYENA